MIKTVMGLRRVAKVIAEGKKAEKRFQQAIEKNPELKKEYYSGSWYPKSWGDDYEQ